MKNRTGVLPGAPRPSASDPRMRPSPCLSERNGQKEGAIPLVWIGKIPPTETQNVGPSAAKRSLVSAWWCCGKRDPKAARLIQQQPPEEDRLRLPLLRFLTRTGVVWRHPKPWIEPWPGTSLLPLPCWPPHFWLPWAYRPLMGPASALVNQMNSSRRSG